MATGIAALFVGAYYLRTDTSPRRTVILTDNILKCLMVAGVYVILNSLIGLTGSLAPLTRKAWLTCYVWLIAIAILVETGVGIWLWTRALDIHDLYGYNWRNLWTDEIKQVFQDEGKCCGYLGPSDHAMSGSGTCGQQAAFGCMLSVQHYAQDYLAYVYTCVFSFVFIDVATILSGMVLLVMRNDEERWRWSRANAIFRSMNKLGSSMTILNSEMQASRLPHPMGAYYEKSG
ncbi:hypothetical protein GGI07_005620 [Coemansia sp. Benny D115]|nr:hypothetical protein GGI07_005620 [Coemansia sp. Benny D115]